MMAKKMKDMDGQEDLRESYKTDKVIILEEFIVLIQFFVRDH